MRRIKLYREFVDNNSIDAKMEELVDLISNIEGDDELLYNWVDDNNNELVINYTFNGESIKYEFNIENLYFTKTVDGEITQEEDVNNVDDGMDLIEKDIQNTIGVNEDYNRS